MGRGEIFFILVLRITRVLMTFVRFNVVIYLDGLFDFFRRYVGMTGITNLLSCGTSPVMVPILGGAAFAELSRSFRGAECSFRVNYLRTLDLSEDLSH